MPRLLMEKLCAGDIVQERLGVIRIHIAIAIEVTTHFTGTVDHLAVRSKAAVASRAVVATSR